jgi:hypothetical protein
MIELVLYFLLFYVPLKCLRVLSRVRVLQAEYHCFRVVSKRASTIFGMLVHIS